MNTSIISWNFKRVWKILVNSQSETHVCSIVIFECSFMYDIGWRTPALQNCFTSIYVLCSTPFVYVCTIFDNKLVYIWILMLKKMINSHISRYELNISLIANLADMSRHGHFLIVFFSKHRFKKYRTQRVTSWYGIRLEQDLICRRAEPCWQTEKKPLEQKRRISCTAAHNSVTTL